MVYETRKTNGRTEIKDIEGNWRDVETYREGMDSWPSFARKSMGSDGYVGLTEAVYQPAPCGCKAVGAGTLQFPLTVEHCERHAAVA
jgi:hypothetical protein